MGIEALNVKFDPNEEYEFIITPIHELYYSDETDFGVYKFSTDEQQPFTTKMVDFEGNVRYAGDIAGITGKLEYGAKYQLLCRLELNKKYNKMQYTPLGISVVKPTTIEESRVFIRACGLSERQADGLLSAYPDAIDRIINEDEIDLKKVKGIKEVTLGKLTKQVKRTFTSLELVTFLTPLGVSLSSVLRIFEDEENPSPSVIKKKLKENPYRLTRIKGFGFKKADDIALRMNESFRNSRFRTEAFIKYYLREQANSNGHTWVSSEQFLSACRDNIPECKEFIFEILKEENEWLYTDKINKRIGLVYYKRLEEKIAKEILRIRDGQTDLENFNSETLNSKIKKIEDEQGFDFTDEQKDAIYQVYKGNIVAITGGAGCVDGDTEYFNGTEWVKIKDYNQGDMVLQFDNITREATLVEPIRYIKEEESTLYRMKNYSGSIDQVLSADHNFAYITSKNHIRTKSFAEVIEKNNQEPYGCGYKIINAFNYNGEGIDLSDDWIRLMIAVFADGSYYYKAHEYNDSYLTCRFHIKKERKKERLRYLIKKVGISYRETQSAAEGYTDIYIKTPFRAKTFPKTWYKANKHQLEIIFNEIFYWDGTFGQKGRRSFSTTIKSDADFVQFVASSLGYTANIGTYDRVGQMRGEYERKSLEYCVVVSINKWRYTSMKTRELHIKQNIKTYTEHDGYKYCFTVPTGYLVLRRNDKIFITGNCGKTSVVNGILKSTDVEQDKIAQVALAGKAALRIQEINGFPASTIHRLLGFEMGQFVHNKDNKLDNQYIVIDEASMIGAELFYDLLQAIPTGSRVVIMGDTGQLDSIGVGSVFKDMLSSNVIPVVKLTKIHRQAQKSAIITESIKVSQGKNIIPNGFTGSKTLGELQDLVLDISNDKDDTVDMVMERFKEELKQESIDEIQVIVPMKERGSACTYRLNNKIQEIVNPHSDGKRYVTMKANTKVSYVIREGDKVINVVNQYQTTDLSNKICPVFNGNLGTVVNIMAKEMIVDFVGIGEVIIPKDKWKSLELGYAISCHKSQGSQWKKVIVGLDSSSYIMLSKELLYTAMTRASKKCYICGEGNAIKQACATSKLLKKNTFLKELIEE